MKRAVMFCVAALLALGPVSALAQGKEKPKPPAQAEKGSDTAAQKKMLTANGTVTAVTATSLTIKAATGDMTFAVDSETNVTAPGAGRKTAALKTDKKPTPITEFVNVGDTVRVQYHDMGATKHAAAVRVTNPNKPVK